MRRVKRKNGRIGAVVLFFAAAVVIASLAVIAWLYYYAGEQSWPDEVLYTFSPEESVQMVQGDGWITLRSDQIISASDYQKEYLQKINRIVPGLILLFSTVLIVTLFFVWRCMRYLEKKKLQVISEQIVNASEGIAGMDEPLLEKAYRKLKNDFDGRLSNYKKLTTYLSHEQKNELAVLRSRLELSGEEDALKNVDNIIESIDNVITLSELEATNEERVDIALICAEACDRYRVLAEIDFDFEEDQSTVIKGKHRWIYRAVANLLDNAVKYGNHQPVFVQVSVKHGSVIVLVKDKGVGMSEEEQLSIFNNAYRVNELKRNGYGIGLSVVAHVCDLCGGFVSVESTQGSGSSFYLSFPQEQPEL